MAKFLKIDTGANGEFLIPADGFIWARRNNDASSFLIYISPNIKEIIKITHGSTTGHEVSDFFQNQMVNLAETNWRNAVVDITDKCPFQITDIAIV